MRLLALLLGGLLGLGPPQLPPPRKSLPPRPRSTPRRPRWQTPFPGNFQPRPLEYQRWTTRQLDSLAAPSYPAPGQRSFALTVPALDYQPSWTRHFFRVSSRPPEWVEVQFGLAAPDSHNLPHTEFAVDTVSFEPGGPPELRTWWSCASLGSGIVLTRHYTQLITLSGPPTVVWQSEDSCEEESHGLASDVSEGSHDYESVGRELTLRHGLLVVPKLHYFHRSSVGEYEYPIESYTRSYIFPDSLDYFNHVTQITPGRYRYQGGRFRRVPDAAGASHRPPARPASQRRN